MRSKRTFTQLFSFILASLVFLTPICTALNQTTEVDVLILGAGMAGLTAANHLQNNGIMNFLVLEGQDYIGGRVKKVTIGNITVGEGANWVHLVEEGSDNPILQLAKKLKLTGYLNNDYDVELKNTVADMALFNKTMKDLHDAGEKIINDNGNMPGREDQPLCSALAVKGWIPDTPLKSAVEWYRLDFEYGVRTDMMSTRLYTGLPEKNSIVTDPRGSALIIEYVKKNVTRKIQTEKIAKEIKYSSNGVEVKTQDGHTYKAKYGLCTFSSGVLSSARVKFTPQLPLWKKEAASRIPLAYYTNVFVKFPNAFWEDKEYLINARSVRRKFAAIYNINKKGIHPGSNTLLFTALEDDSLRIENQPDSVTAEEVMKALEDMYPKANISYPTEIFVSKWSTNPFIKGSYSYAAVGSSPADFHNLEGRLENLFFAGEACDEEYFGYLQGAYFTGMRQAKAIVKCINGGECAIYKPEKMEACPPGNGVPSGRRNVQYVVCLLLANIYMLFLA